MERIRSCKSPEEVLELAKAEGYELSDEQLEQVAGAFVWDDEERKERIRKQKDEDALLCPLQEPSQGAASRTCVNYEVFHVHEHRFSSSHSIEPLVAMRGGERQLS